MYLFGDISKLCHVILSLNKVSRFEMQPLCNIFELQGDPSIPGNGEMDPASFHSQISPPNRLQNSSKKTKNMLTENPRCFSFKNPIKKPSDLFPEVTFKLGCKDPVGLYSVGPPGWLVISIPYPSSCWC